MGRYNETDYKNALNVIKTCKKYVSDKFGDTLNNDNFPKNYKLYLLDETTNYYKRGGAQTFLTITYNGLSTCDFCEDGTEWSHDIHVSEIPYTYAYNNTEQKTINLAIVLAKHWDTIKTRIHECYGKYMSKKTENSDLLARFSI